MFLLVKSHIDMGYTYAQLYAQIGSPAWPTECTLCYVISESRSFSILDGAHASRLCLTCLPVQQRHHNKSETYYVVCLHTDNRATSHDSQHIMSAVFVYI